MTNPFVYPKSRHTRRKNPGPFTTIASYRSAVREEFDGRCVYCRIPDRAQSLRHEVEHYRPTKHFPQLKYEYSNLYWACRACNGRKGSFWPAELDLATRFIPNPCEHRMFEHLRFDGVRVVPRTEAGRCAEELLDLNDDETQQFRAAVIDSLAAWDRRISKLRRGISVLDARLRQRPCADEARLSTERAILQARVDETLEHMRAFGAVL